MFVLQSLQEPSVYHLCKGSGSHPCLHKGAQLSRAIWGLACFVMCSYNHNNSTYIVWPLSLNTGWSYMVGQEKLYVHLISVSAGFPLPVHRQNLHLYSTNTQSLTLKHFWQKIKNFAKSALSRTVIPCTTAAKALNTARKLQLFILPNIIKLSLRQVRNTVQHTEEHLAGEHPTFKNHKLRKL